MLIKFIMFALVGIIGTTAHYLVLYQLVESHGFEPVIASAYGAVAGMCVNYLLNYLLTFKSQQAHVRAFPKFVLISGIGFSVNYGLMMLLTPYLFYLYAQVATTALVLVWNFLGNSLWTFRVKNA